MAEKSEKAILNDTLVALSREFHPEGLFWRNNSGSAWRGEIVRRGVGQTVTVEAGMVILRKAQLVSFGLPGSPDIIGVLQGRFVGPEIKTATGRQEKTQVAFEAAFRRAGGLYVLGRSPEETIAAIRAAM